MPGDKRAERALAQEKDRSSTRQPSATDYGLPEHVSCPFCGDDDTELHSPFGPQLSVASYWCRRCRTAFDWVKRRDS